jgi:ParB family transcriptional regulator, chromosome partitioning protein
MMAEARRGLGRGLSALLDEVDPALAAAGTTNGLQDTLLELLQANPHQPRRTFGEEEIAALAESVKTQGVLQPILVRPAPQAPGRFEIVAGERRWRAAKRAGLTAVPTLVRELDDREVLEIGIVENVQREDLNPLDEALAYKALIERFGHTQAAVADAVGKSRSYVTNCLRLLQLPEAVQAHLQSGKLTTGHARAIAAAENPEALAEQILAGGLNVRETETLARERKGKASPPRAGSKDTDTVALENDLADVLGMAVEIADKGGVGELRVRYKTLEQLDDLCRRLTRA